MASTGISQKFKYFPNSKLNHSTYRMPFVLKYNNHKYEQLSVWSLIKNVMLTYQLWTLYVLWLCAKTCTPNRPALIIPQVHYTTLIWNIFASGAKPYKVHVFEFARHGAGCGLWKFPVKAVKINWKFDWMKAKDRHSFIWYLTISNGIIPVQVANSLLYSNA